MRLICLTILLFIYYGICYSDEMKKYYLLREQCSQLPTHSECLQLRSKFLQLIEQCQEITTPQQFLACQEVKLKYCVVFPSYCLPTTTNTITLTKRRTTTKPKVKKTKSKVKKTKPKVKKSNTTTTKTTTTTTPTPTTTTTGKIRISETIIDDEFGKVPLNPDVLRTRGEYCVRHGKEKKCQDLLNNLKTTYSKCSKKKPETKPIKSEELDCHSFETHMCQAFPKFPPCIKKVPKLI